MGNFVKFICRLIESDMAIVAKSQKLEVYTPKRLDQRLISCAFLIAVWLRAVRKMRVCRIDIYLVKQIFVHKVVVTLIIGSWKPLVFVQIHGFHG